MATGDAVTFGRFSLHQAAMRSAASTRSAIRLTSITAELVPAVSAARRRSLASAVSPAFSCAAAWTVLAHIACALASIVGAGLRLGLGIAVTVTGAELDAGSPVGALVMAAPQMHPNSIEPTAMSTTTRGRTPSLRCGGTGSGGGYGCMGPLTSG